MSLNLDKDNEDIILIAEGDEHKAHRAVLQISVPYFKAMFSMECRESNEDAITLPVVPSKGLASLLEYAYSGRVEVTEENMPDILIAADYLQCHNVVEVCKKFLMETINAENCVAYYNMVLMYVSDFVPNVLEFLSRNFAIISKDDLSGVNEKCFIEVLQSPQLQCQDEFHLYDVVLQWLNHNEASEELQVKMLKNIRFGLMSVEKLTTLEANPMITQSEELSAKLKQAIDYRTHDTDLPSIPCLSELRGQMGFIQVNSEQREISAFPISHEKATNGYIPKIRKLCFDEMSDAELSFVPEPKAYLEIENNITRITEENDLQDNSEKEVQSGHFITSIPSGYHAIRRITTRNNFLFVITKKSTDLETGHECDVLRYEVATNTWKKLCFLYALPEDDNQFFFVATAEYLVCIEQHPKQYDDYFDDPCCFRYSMSQDEKLPAECYPLKQCKISEHQGCTLNGLVYMCGGQVDRGLLSRSTTKAYSYDPEIDMYLDIASMNQAHQDYFVTTDGKCVFALGGQNRVYDMELDSWSCGYNPFESSDSDGNDPPIPGKPECYNPETNQWTVLEWTLQLDKNLSSRSISISFMDPHFYLCEEDEYNSVTCVKQISSKSGKSKEITRFEVEKGKESVGFGGEYPGPCRYAIMQVCIPGT